MPLTDDELRAFIAAHPWTFAKTMPQWPHWYVVKAKHPMPDLFPTFASTIIARGYQAVFRPYPAHRGFRRWYLDLDGFHYWHMDPLTKDVTLINRGCDPNIAERIS